MQDTPCDGGVGDDETATLHGDCDNGKTLMAQRVIFKIKRVSNLAKPFCCSPVICALPRERRYSSSSPWQ